MFTLKKIIWFLFGAMLFLRCSNGRLTWQAANPAPPPATGAGSSDATFNGGRPLLLFLGEGDSEARGAVIQPDGKLVVVGWATVEGADRFTVVRFLPDGTLDPVFNSGGALPGTVHTDILRDSRAFAVTILDGNIYVAGEARAGDEGQHLAIARYLPDGTPDQTFGTNGHVTSFISVTGSGSEKASARAIHASSSALHVSGYVDTVSSSAVSQLAARYSAAGVIDTIGWPTDGYTRYQAGGDALANGLFFPGPDLIMGGALADHFGVVKLDATGLPSGQVVTQIGSKSTIYALLANGFNRVAAVGSALSSGRNSCAVAGFSVVPFQADGEFNGGAAGQTFVQFNMGTGTSDVCRAGAVQTDGKIVVAGTSALGGENYFGLSRLNANGSMDTGFGTQGRVTLDAGEAEEAYAVLLQSDGKILTVGTALQEGRRGIAVTRTTP